MNWIRGQSIIRFRKWKEFELLQAFKSGVSAYNTITGEPFIFKPISTSSPKMVCKYEQSCLEKLLNQSQYSFKLSEIEAYENRHRVGQGMKHVWIAAEDILTRWNAKPFEVIAAAKNGLPIYSSHSGKRFAVDLYPDISSAPPASQPKIAKLLHEMDKYLLQIIYGYKRDEFDPYFDADVDCGFIFKLSEVEAYEQTNDIVPVSVGVSAGPEVSDKPVPVTIPVPKGTTWEQVTIRIANPNRYEITVPGKKMEPWTTEQLGLARSPALTDLFEKYWKGTINELPSKESWVKQNISRLRTIFKGLFPDIDGDPLPRKQNKYTTSFNLSMFDHTQ